MRDIKIIIKEDSNLNTYNIETIPNKVLKGNTAEAEELMDTMVKIATGEIE